MSGQIQSGVGGPSSPVPIVGDGWVQLQGPEGKKLQWDTLSPAEQSILLQYILTSQIPILSPPQEVQQGGDSAIGALTVTQQALHLEQTKNQMITQMLDGWLESIKQLAEQSKRADEKRMIDKVENAYHAFQGQENAKSDGAFPLFVLGMVIAGSAVIQAMVVGPTQGVMLNPIVDMYSKVIVPVVGNMHAEMGLVGAFFAAGIQCFTAAELASKSSKGGTGSNGDFAKGYAGNIINLMNSPSFNSYVSNLVTKSLAEGKPLNEATMNDYSSMVKLVLLSSSLAMLYQSEAGRMTGIEFKGMLKGEIAFQKGDLRNALVLMIQSNLSLMTPKTRELLLESLTDYFDTNPSIESLSNPAEVFSGIHKTLPRSDLLG